jgi:hypothetical protein
VRSNQFLSLWYGWRKPSTYIALMLAPSLNRPKEDSTKPHHLGVPSGASKTISKSMVHLVQTVHPSCVKISTISKRTEMSFHLSVVI